MMLSETLFLDQNCENCQSKEYMEHDSGFYVCVNCAVVSQMRHGLAVDYKDLNLKGMRYKRKNIDEIDEEEQVDLNNFETNMNTHNNTCANSEYNDSVSSKLTKNENTENKSLSEVLLDHQNFFLKIFKSVFFFQYMKQKKFLDSKKKYNISNKNLKEFGELNKFESFENFIFENNLSSFKENINKIIDGEKHVTENLILTASKNNNEKDPIFDFNNYRYLQKEFYEKILLSDNQKINLLNLNQNFHEESKKNFKNLYNLAKEKWMQFIKEEYENQVKRKGPNFRKRGMRSRRYTEDEFSQMNNTVATNNSININNSNFNSKNLNSSNLNFIISNNFNSQKDKRVSINDELKTRKIKSRNIIQLNAYKNTRLRDKEKKKKFIEEHDQVLTSLKKSQDYIKNKTGIIIDETVSFKNMLILSDLFGIKVNENSTYEDIIHSFFIAKELNYRNLYSENTYDENKSNLNADNFLLLIFECFNNKINIFNKDYPIMICEIISIYKKYYLGNLHLQELKFLKYLSKEKLYKSFEKIKIPNTIYLNIIEYISLKLLKMPSLFKNFSINIFKICEIAIFKNLTHIYNYEAFSISIIVLSLRYIYGLNDLPYLSDIKKAYLNGIMNNSIFGDKLFQETFLMVEEISIKDKIFKIYKEMPSILEVVENLINLIKIQENNSSLWEGMDFKKHLLNEVKEKYLYYNNNCLFPKLEKISCVRNINELDKKINSKLNINEGINIDTKIMDKKERKLSLVYRKQSIDMNCDFYSIEKYNEINSEEIKNKKFNDNNYLENTNDSKKNIFNVKFSKKFQSKLNKKTIIAYRRNENIDNKESISIRKENLNKFLKEEFDFYKMIIKKNKKDRKIAIPLPCDTIIRYNKKAFKFDGIIPPTTELMIYYLFSKQFKIEVQVIRKCIKILEKVIEEKIK